VVLVLVLGRGGSASCRAAEPCCHRAHGSRAGASHECRGAPSESCPAGGIEAGNGNADTRAANARARLDDAGARRRGARISRAIGNRPGVAGDR
jgi:hypothetical protein